MNRKTSSAASLRQPLCALALVAGLAQVGCVESDFAGSPDDGGTSSALPDAGRRERDGAADARSVAPDAGTSLLSEDDAGMPSEGRLTPPAWAEHLLGHYAVRVRNFSRERISGAATSHEIISAGQIFYDQAAAEVRLRVRMCQNAGDALGLVKARLAYPHWYPQRLLRVAYENGEFYSKSITVDTVGYDDTPRPDCSQPGQLVNRMDAQAWLSESGKCECPDPAVLVPVRKEDCRVTDPDRDSNPGITLLSDFGGVMGRDYVVTRDDSQFEHAKIDPVKKQHHGSYGVNQVTSQLECPGGTCTRAEMKPCPTDANEVDFAPLNDPGDGELWPCAELLEVAGSLLPPDKLQFPDALCP